MLFMSLLTFIYLLTLFYLREINMKINTEFKGNNIPYEYAAGADISDLINGNQLNHSRLK